VEASSIDHHDCVFPGERRRIAPARVFVMLRTRGEGPRGHETSHHVAVLELVPDKVCVVWAGFLDEPLEVVRRWTHLILVAVWAGFLDDKVCLSLCAAIETRLTPEPPTSLSLLSSWLWSRKGATCTSFCSPICPPCHCLLSPSCFPR
jgi:hypothetical protein